MDNDGQLHLPWDERARRSLGTDLGVGEIARRSLGTDLGVGAHVKWLAGVD